MLFLFGILLVASIDSVLIPWLSDGLTVEAFSKLDLKKFPEFINIRRFEQLIVQLVVFVAPALVFAYLAFPRPKQYLKINTKINWRHLALGAGIMLLSIPFINLLEYFNKMIPITQAMKDAEEVAKTTTELLLNTNDAKLIVFNFLLFAIMPAIVEELLFRGAFQNILLSSQTFKKYPFMAIAIAAIFFSLMHLQMAGFIPRFYAGFILGCAYYFSNNILVPMLMHAINNSLALLLFYVSKSNFEDAIGTLDYKDFLEIVPLTLFGLFLFYKFYQKRTTYVIDKVEIDPDETHFLANK